MEDLACNERLLCPLLNTRYGTMTAIYFKTTRYVLIEMKELDLLPWWKITSSLMINLSNFDKKNDRECESFYLAYGKSDADYKECLTLLLCILS